MAIKHIHIFEDTSEEVAATENGTIETDIVEAQQDMGMQQDPRIKGAEFVARCRAAATAMHFVHLTTSSYSEHIATQEFYEGVIPLMDAVAEDMIGRFGKFEAFPNVKESSQISLQIVGNLTKWLDANRALMGEFSEIQNGIDGVLSLSNSTAFKLRELK